MCKHFVFSAISILLFPMQQDQTNNYRLPVGQDENALGRVSWEAGGQFGLDTGWCWVNWRKPLLAALSALCKRPGKAAALQG